MQARIQKLFHYFWITNHILDFTKVEIKEISIYKARMYSKQSECFQCLSSLDRIWWCKCNILSNSILWDISLHQCNLSQCNLHSNNSRDLITLVNKIEEINMFRINSIKRINKIITMWNTRKKETSGLNQMSNLG